MIAGAPGRRRDQRRSGARRGTAGRPRAGAGPRATRRPDRRRVPRRHRGARHRARRRLQPGLGASRLHRRAGGAAASATSARTRRAADRGDRRRLRDRDRYRPRLCVPTCASAASIRPARSAVFGAAMAVGKLRGLSRRSSSPRARHRGIERGRPVRLRQRRRRHQAAARRPCLARRIAGGAARRAGVEGPPDVIEARDGFMQAFAFGRADKARADRAAAGRAVRHHRLLHQAVRRAAATSSRRSRRCSACSTTRRSTTDEIKHVEVETYRIAAEHARTGWDDYASAQLSFPYLMALAARFRGIKVAHFNEQTRRDPAFGGVRREAHRHGAARDRRALSANCARRASP